MSQADRLARGPMMTGGTPLSMLDEDELLEHILPLFGGSPDLLVPPGDDAALLRTSPLTVATTDTAVLGRDWLDAWSSGSDVGHKVVVQNLADVAAMGAVPTGVLLTLVADPALSLEWVLDHAAGLGAACAAADVAVLGGDLSSAPAGVVMVSVTALGRLDGPVVLRSGARPGDVLAVCGSLGLAAAGLRLLASGDPERHPLAVERQRRPMSPLAAGPAAAAAGATAMLDLSDGLVRDASRIARASGVALEIDAAALAPDVDVLRAALGDAAAVECVVSGGEEHSLLASFPGADLPAGWRAIGRVVPTPEGSRPSVLVDGRPVTHTGWDHFREE
ncbi:MAG: thiamine-phosphate kinase [Humibacillus sp.]|nr:thiamine-phosphate kinase [Humibacillus sp.]